MSQKRNKIENISIARIEKQKGGNKNTKKKKEKKGRKNYARKKSMKREYRTPVFYGVKNKKEEAKTKRKKK